jgi:RNA-binding protein
MKIQGSLTLSNLTSKQRAKLRSLASGIEPSFQIGKEGISDTLIRGISQHLEKNELIKITVLKNSQEDSKELLQELAWLLLAEPVASIGHKIVLYRRSESKEIKHIEL